MSEHLQEPSIPEQLKWPLAALWISLGVHGALIALVQVAPPPTVASRGTIEARLVSVPRPITAPQLAPSIETDETLAVDVTEFEPKGEPEVAPISEPPAVSPIAPSPPESAMSRLEIPVAVDLNYYTSLELDQRPEGEIPEPALPAELSGKIKFQVKIEEDGRVSDVEVMATDPPDIFEEAALEIAAEALRGTRFMPGIKNGRPVRSRAIYELIINPTGAEGPARD